MTDHKVMQLALNALENLIEYDFHGKPLTDSSVQGEVAITALREALARPEPEPVAWIDKFGNVFPLAAMRGPAWDREPWKPLYLAPPEPKVQKGWKLVPIEPSPAMDFAGAKATEDMLSATISKSMGTLGGHIVRNDYDDIALAYANDDISSVMGIYKAMITAAPEYKETLK